MLFYLMKSNIAANNRAQHNTNPIAASLPVYPEAVPLVVLYRVTFDRNNKTQ